MKYEVGDRVRLVRSSYSFEGSVGIVKELNDDGQPVTLTRMDNSIAHPEPEEGWTLDHDEVELVQKGKDESEETDRPTRRFKRGDTVKVHRPDSENEREKEPGWVKSMDKYDGIVAVVDSTISSAGYVKLKEAYVEGFYYKFHSDWLEHYSPEDEKDGFKKDDKVKIVKRHSDNSTGGCRRNKKDDVGKIGHIRRQSTIGRFQYVVDTDDGKYLGIFGEDEIKHYSEEDNTPQTQLKPGDRVILRRPHTEEERKRGPFWEPEMDDRDGMEATVDHVDEDGVSVHGSIYMFHPNWLELVHTVDAIQAGSEVEVVDCCEDCNGATFYVDEDQLTDSRVYPPPKFKEDLCDYFELDGEVKLVSGPKESQSENEEGQSQHQFSVGQRVKVVHKGKGGTQHFLGTGDVGTVTEVCSNDDIKVRVSHTDYQYVPAVELEIVDEAADVPDESTVNSLPSLTEVDLREAASRIPDHPPDIFPGFEYNFPRQPGMTCQRVSGMSLAVDAPTLNEFPSDDSKLDKKGGLMSALRSIPTRLKRLLNANFKAFYQLQWVDEDMELTPDGKKELIDVLFDEYESKLGERAKSEVDRIQKEEKQKGCK